MIYKQTFQWIGKKGALLAPMAGVTDAAFRQVAQENGALLCFTEMVNVKGLLYGNSKSLDIARVFPEEGKVGIQLFGREPEDFARAIALLEDIEGEHIAAFDINMGCPAPKIVNNGEGAALMKEPVLAVRILRSAKETSSLPVTVKFRKGFDRDSVNCVEFAQMAEEAGVDALTMHGRLREDYYAGAADWDAIAAVKRAVGIPVIANGDVFSPEDAGNMLVHTGADGVMVGRGALGNPFIFRQVADFLASGKYAQVHSVQRLETMKRQALLCLRIKGEHLAMIEFRKHAAWYLKGLPGAAVLRKAALSIEKMEDLQVLFEQVLFLAERQA